MAVESLQNIQPLQATATADCANLRLCWRFGAILTQILRTLLDQKHCSQSKSPTKLRDCFDGGAASQ